MRAAILAELGGERGLNLIRVAWPEAPGVAHDDPASATDRTSSPVSAISSA
jgi:hypothetical protein